MLSLEPISVNALTTIVHPIGAIVTTGALPRPPRRLIRGAVRLRVTVGVTLMDVTIVVVVVVVAERLVISAEKRVTSRESVLKAVVVAVEEAVEEAVELVITVEKRDTSHANVPKEAAVDADVAEEGLFISLLNLLFL